MERSKNNPDSYTPGPWTAGGNIPYRGNECYIFDGSTPEKLIAHLGPHDGYPSPSFNERIANAHLIAAAPDLLEALQTLTTLAESYHCQLFGVDGLHLIATSKTIDTHPIIHARNIINKALNKQ